LSGVKGAVAESKVCMIVSVATYVKHYRRAFERALEALLSFQYSYWKGRTGGHESGEDAVKTGHRGW